MNRIIGIGIILTLSMSACRNDSSRNNSSEVQPQNDSLIVPGKRIGMITGETTEAEVEAAYGKENIRIQSLYVAEGEQREGILLFPDSPDELEIIWEFAAHSGTPAFIRIGQEGGKWTTAEGISVGITLEKLEAINGKPFKFYGFEWDYGGLVTDWNGGKISPYLVVALIPQQFDQLGPALLGEVQLSSDDPRVRALRAKVGSLVLTFE